MRLQILNYTTLDPVNSHVPEVEFNLEEFNIGILPHDMNTLWLLTKQNAPYAKIACNGRNELVTLMNNILQAEADGKAICRLRRSLK